MNLTPPTIRDVQPSELTACLQWLLEQVPVERAQWIVSQLTDRVKLKQMGDILTVEAVSDGELASAAIAVLVKPNAGNLLAISRYSKPIRKRAKKMPERIHAAVFEHLVARLRAASVTFLQTSTGPDETARNIYELGFDRLATLAFFVLEANAFAASPDAAANAELRFEVVGDDLQRLSIACEVAERSFANTRDCPLLSDYRTAAEIVTGYRMAATFDPSLWRLLMVGEEPAGCLFLTQHPVADAGMGNIDGLTRGAIELSYMGLVPEHRGRGLGSHILAEAVRVARQKNAIRMVLAVDMENTPAIMLYRRCEWREAARESVWAMRITP